MSVKKLPYLPKIGVPSEIVEVDGILYRYDGVIRTWVFLGSVSQFPLVDHTTNGLVTPEIVSRLGLLRSAFFPSNGISSQKFKLYPHTNAYWYRFVSNDRLISIKPEGADIRLEVDRGRLNRALMSNGCVGSKGPKGPDGLPGKDGLPGPLEYYYTPNINNNQLKLEVQVETPLETQISCRLFRATEHIASTEIWLDIQTMTTSIISSDLDITLDDVVIIFDRHSKNFSLTINNKNGWNGLWRAKVRQRGPRGLPGKDGTNFLDIFEVMVPTTSSSAIATLYNIPGRSDIYYSAYGFNIENSVANLRPYLGNSGLYLGIFDISTEYLAAVIPTIEQYKQVCVYRFIPQNYNLDINLPIWTPISACLDSDRYESTKFEYSSIAFSLHSSPFMVVNDSLPPERKCQEEFFFCPNVGKEACGIDSEIFIPKPGVPVLPGRRARTVGGGGSVVSRVCSCSTVFAYYTTEPTYPYQDVAIEEWNAPAEPVAKLILNENNSESGVIIKKVDDTAGNVTANLPFVARGTIDGQTHRWIHRVVVPSGETSLVQYCTTLQEDWCDRADECAVSRNLAGEPNWIPPGSACVHCDVQAATVSVKFSGLSGTAASFNGITFRLNYTGNSSDSWANCKWESRDTNYNIVIAGDANSRKFSLTLNVLDNRRVTRQFYSVFDWKCEDITLTDSEVAARKAEVIPVPFCNFLTKVEAIVIANGTAPNKLTFEPTRCIECGSDQLADSNASELCLQDHPRCQDGVGKKWYRYNPAVTKWHIMTIPGPFDGYLAIDVNTNLQSCCRAYYLDVSYGVPDELSSSSSDSDPSYPPTTDSDPSYPPTTDSDPSYPPTTDSDPSYPPTTDSDPSYPSDPSDPSYPPPDGCKYSISAGIIWENNADLDLYAQVGNIKSEVIWHGRFAANGLQLNRDAHPGCDSGGGGYEVIKGDFTSSNYFYFWYDQYSNCEEQTTPTKARIMVANTGECNICVSFKGEIKKLVKGEVWIAREIAFSGYATGGSSGYSKYKTTIAVSCGDECVLPTEADPPTGEPGAPSQ